MCPVLQSIVSLTKSTLLIKSTAKNWGWSGGAKVLGKLPVPGRPTNLDYSRARAYCACNRCGWGLFGHFSLIYHFSFLYSSLWETARYRLKYCPKGPLNPEQPTNQLQQYFCWSILKTFCTAKRSHLFWAKMFLFFFVYNTFEIFTSPSR